MKGLALSLLFVFFPCGQGRAALLDEAFFQARGLVQRAPDPILRLPFSEVRRQQAQAYLPLRLGRTPVDVSIGFSYGDADIDEWGKFRIEGEEFVLPFRELDKGVRLKGFLFQNVYQMTRRTLRVTRLLNGDRAEADYLDLLEMLSRQGLPVRLAGREFAVFVEEDAPIPASITLISPGAASLYLRSGLLAGERISWLFSWDGRDYGFRPEGGHVVFYERTSLAP